MIVEADEGRFRIRLGHDDRRCAESASDVGNLGAALELLFDAPQRGNPLADQMRVVARAEKSFRALEETLVMLVPSESAAAPEALGDLRLVDDHRLNDLEDAVHVERARFVGKHERLL